MIVVLCGGFGAARFVRGLADALAEQTGADHDLVCVVNSGDDFEHLGMQVCPDLDSVTYALGGRFHEQRGFGLCDDTLACNAALARYGLDWFLMGDQDIAHSLARTALLAGGATLSEATARITAPWRLPGTVLPMSDQPVRTRVETPNGELALQEYLVTHRGEPAVMGVRYAGIETAAAAPGVLELLSSASVVLLAPSNPVSSLGPILALAGVRECLAHRARPTVAVTPVVNARIPSTAAEGQRAAVRSAFLASQDTAHTPAGVAARYAEFTHGFVLDSADDAHHAEIQDLGVAVHATDTLAPPADRAGFAAEVLAFAQGLAPH